MDPGWGYNVGVNGGLEFVGRSGWGGVLDATLLHHGFTQTWTYTPVNGEPTIRETRNYRLLQLALSAGVLYAF